MNQFRSLRKVSSSLISVFSSHITIQQIKQGTYNVADGNVGETITESVVKGFFEDVKKTELNTLIQQNDKKVMISRGDLTFEPSLSDRIVISGITYAIIQINKEMVNGEDVYYQIFLRS
tara:strand:+ start:15973 stop:16329 length:357 start_codon:yes stop_codon:yes gene_type:complete